MRSVEVGIVYVCYVRKRDAYHRYVMLYAEYSDMCISLGRTGREKSCKPVKITCLHAYFVVVKLYFPLK